MFGSQIGVVWGEGGGARARVGRREFNMPATDARLAGVTQRVVDSEERR